MDRQQWMGILARAPEAVLEEALKDISPLPEYSLLRPAETGLAMVRGRAGGVGMSFNLGEMTVTRCAVQLAQGPAGFGYVAGRGTRKAELAALFDALLQDPARRTDLLDRLILPQRKAQAEQRERVQAQARATRVEFFTMVRGDDA